MYVCICNAITDRDIAEAATNPDVQTPHCVHASFNTSPQCGHCLDYIADMLDELREAPVSANSRQTEELAVEF